MLERVDLRRDGGEAAAAYAHVLASTRPECAEEIERVQWAIVLCGWGLCRWPVTIAGRTDWAGVHVAELGLEEFVRRRISAKQN
jgi:hypothetical protein